VSVPPPSLADQTWISAAEERLHARETALAESLHLADDKEARLQRLAGEIAEHEKQVAQREAAVRAVRPPSASLPRPPRSTRTLLLGGVLTPLFGCRSRLSVSVRARRARRSSSSWARWV